MYNIKSHYYDIYILYEIMRLSQNCDTKKWVFILCFISKCCVGNTFMA